MSLSRFRHHICSSSTESTGGGKAITPDMLKDMDASGDGEITKLEFVKFVLKVMEGGVVTV